MIISWTLALRRFWDRSTLDDFQHFGNTRVLMERLKSLVKEGTILQATDFNILVEMPSGPCAFVVSKLASKSKISSSVHNRSSEQLPGSVTIADSTNGG